MAHWTGSLRTVEREKVGKWILVGDIACLTLKLVREDEFLSFVRVDFRFSPALFYGELEGIDQSIPLLSVQDHPVHKDIDFVFFFNLEIVEVHDFPVLYGPEKTVLLEAAQSSFSRPGKGYLNSCLLWKHEQSLDDGVDCVALDRLAALEAVDGSDAGVQDSQKIKDLGHCGHGGARILGNRLLLDGDGRCDALDRVSIGFVHPL